MPSPEVPSRAAEALTRVAQAASLPLPRALELALEPLAGDLAALPDAAVAPHASALLLLARLLEPSLRVAQRAAALDRAASLDPGLRHEVDAERAIDLAKNNQLDAAETLARQVLTDCGDDEPVATARATEALGRVLAWRGTAAAAAHAAGLLSEAAELYRRLDTGQWRGFVLFWQANAVHFQRGQLAPAEQGMREALPLLQADRQAVVLTFLADVLACRGAFAEAGLALDEALRLAAGDRITIAYAAWSRAKIASYLGDVEGTSRLVDEVERDLAGLALANTRATFAADACDLLDRVGEIAAAWRQLERAKAIDRDDEFVLLAEATWLARNGDPERALAALRRVLREPWLEARLIWRVTLFTAWAALRRGDADAGTTAARALDQVVGLGGIEVAMATEGRLVRALLPVAALAGSQRAAELLAVSGWVVRLLGDVVVAADGKPAELPVGQAGELARLVLAHDGGLSVDQAVDVLWPEEDAELARRRLRQVLSRLNARAPGLVLRHGDRLVGQAWVDLRAFDAAVSQALAARSPEQARLALALWGGVPLPHDSYAGWAAAIRDGLRAKRVRALDLLAEDAVRTGDADRAIGYLESAIEADPTDETRYVRAARHQLSMGRRPQARELLDRAAGVIAELGVAPPEELRRLRADVEAPAG